MELTNPFEAEDLVFQQQFAAFGRPGARFTSNYIRSIRFVYFFFFLMHFGVVIRFFFYFRMISLLIGIF
jgi:hypothetical protein